jgi:hypothetical protein
MWTVTLRIPQWSSVALARIDEHHLNEELGFAWTGIDPCHEVRQFAF